MVQQWSHQHLKTNRINFKGQFLLLEDSVLHQSHHPPHQLLLHRCQVSPLAPPDSLQDPNPQPESTSADPYPRLLNSHSTVNRPRAVRSQCSREIRDRIGCFLARRRRVCARPRRILDRSVVVCTRTLAVGVIIIMRRCRITRIGYMRGDRR